MTTPAIVDLLPDHDAMIEQTAVLLLRSFRGHSSAWPDMAAARHEVSQALQPGKVCRVMLDDGGDVIGWAGAMPHYDGNVWELHPLVVAESCRNRGYGSALVRDIEVIVAQRGALTLWLGSDDETDATSLSGADLYADIPGAIAGIKNLRGHPYEFYTRIGFRIVGVMPDANGRGKPDIFLAKRIG